MDVFIALYLFLLAAFTGYAIAAKTSSPLHANLLAAASLINGIVLVGAMVTMSYAETSTQFILGFIAVALASGNLMGGYVLTQKVLKAFSKKNDDFLSGDQS